MSATAAVLNDDVSDVVTEVNQSGASITADNVMERVEDAAFDLGIALDPQQKTEAAHAILNR